MASIGGKMKSAPCAALVEDYCQRALRLAPVAAHRFADEARLLAWLEQTRSKGRVLVYLFDSRGKSLSSEELSQQLGQAGVDGQQHLVFAIGPPDGWSDAARKASDQLIAFGRITLPHELALAVAAEQLYRALAILEGHPYHSGH
ncbi:23S rRNA (pseudouridine(1915)-N(3))-methyltransferase RlmH [Bryocella elongata]|uniref:23S rRNA (pseudouridine(1915)-N(3))-methyltransferase RlmH n=1 Tax=Bryocella elongata TaxID=863522 RepID=UPI0022865C66|nr:23S rRNA (pseudouridine(1915)-N(3))-methyltransferase RlmH [Bryocella elongata]